MKKLYPALITFLLFVLCLTGNVRAQVCNPLTTSYVTTESRCVATGTVLINATGGSGNYQYKANGPINTNYTASNLITGLSAGRYLITIQDLVTNCIYATDSVTIPGTYVTPTFTMLSTDVTCMNGNDGTITVNSQSFGRAPFSYQIIAPSASNVGAVNDSGKFTGLLSGNYLVQLTDSCGAIQTRGISILNFNWFILSRTVTKVGCDSVQVTINLRDNRGNNLPHAVFNGFSYGASKAPGDTTWFSTNTFRYYKGKKHYLELFARDKCGNIQMITWLDNARPAVAATVSISNRACSTFRATITGQANLTNPQYCIYNSANVLQTCNTNGVFSNLLYGSYCIQVIDTCYDTTIVRCFTVAKPVPSVAANVGIVSSCSSFNVSIVGQVNLNNPNYCLYNSANVLVSCNTTGTFNNLAFGQYCIRVINNAACYDTTILRCFTVNRPVPFLGPNVTITNLGCSTFNAAVSGAGNVFNPQYCLYTSLNVLVVCNTTGVFTNIPYGSYCIRLQNDPACYDTIINRCFTVNRPVPSVASSVTISNRTCFTFSATITGKVNLSNPQFCIYDNLNTLVTCNTTGIFNNLTYGNYCIRIKNDSLCYDTTIVRCITVLANNPNIDLSSDPSCTLIGGTDLEVEFLSGTAPFILKLYSPSGGLLQTVTTSTNPYFFLGLARLPGGQKYGVLVEDGCGRKDSSDKSPDLSYANRAISVTGKCPTSLWPNGSSDLRVVISTNLGTSTTIPKIIKKNTAAVNISATTIVGSTYTFADLGPATYVIATTIASCSKTVYDTVQVRAYIFPSLIGSQAYQCDNGSFSVIGKATEGISPYTFEVIGSIPDSPSIISPPQASPLFTINNGSAYSLIRMRTTDLCGNADLADLNVLPVSNLLVFSEGPQCFNEPFSLRVDSIGGATYTWYKRVLPNDSIIVGNTNRLHFDSLLLSDTGRYFCVTTINGSCITRISNYIISGFCMSLLADGVTLNGEKTNMGNLLYWKNLPAGVKSISLQKSSNAFSVSSQTIEVFAGSGLNMLNYTDVNDISGQRYYRLKIVYLNGLEKFSNTVKLHHASDKISIYPVPVQNVLHISLKNNSATSYAVELFNIAGQKIFEKQVRNVASVTLDIQREPVMVPGMYVLKISNLKTGEIYYDKVLFD